MRLRIVRHGESKANIAERAQVARPQDGDALTERGHEQARSLGERLRDEGITRIVASTMRRAQQTAAGVGEVLGLEFQTDPDLCEMRQSDAFNAAELTDAQHASLEWMPRSDALFARPGAESFDELCQRVLRVRQRAQDAPDTDGLLLVTHYGWLHFLLGATLFGDRFTPDLLPGLWRAGHTNTGITILERRLRRMDGIDYPGWHVLTWNDCAHLD